MKTSKAIKAVVWLALGLGLFGLTGCATTTDSAVRGLAPDEVETLSARQAAGKMPDSADPKAAEPLARESKGDQLLAKEQAAAALFEYNRALTKAPPEQAVRLRLKIGQVELRLKQFLQAESQFKAIVDSNPNEALAWQGLGLALLSQGRLNEAAEPLIKAVTLSPKQWKAYNALGVVYNRRGQHDLAIKCFDKAIAVNSTSASLYNNRGLAFMLKNETALAETEFRKALQLDPHHTLALNNLGLLFARQGRWTMAQKSFEIGLGRAKAHHNLGVLLAQSGMNAQAAEQFRQAMQASPSYYHRAYQGLKQVETISYSPATFLPPAVSFLKPQGQEKRVSETTLPPDVKPLEEFKPEPAPVVSREVDRSPSVLGHEKRDLPLNNDGFNPQKEGVDTSRTVRKPATEHTDQSPASPPPVKQTKKVEKVSQSVEPQTLPGKMIKTGSNDMEAINPAMEIEEVKPSVNQREQSRLEQDKRSARLVRMPMPKDNTRINKSVVRMPMPAMADNEPVVAKSVVEEADTPPNYEPAPAMEEAKAKDVTQEVYFLQVATFRDRIKARKLESRLSTQGWRVHLEDWQSPDQKKWQRVLLGPYQAKDQANGLAMEMRKNGLINGHLLVARLER